MFYLGVKWIFLQIVLALELQGVSLSHHQGVLIPLKDLGLVNFFNPASLELSLLDDRDLCPPFPLHSQPCVDLCVTFDNSGLTMFCLIGIIFWQMLRDN